jgi:hypothetical protein
MPLMMRARDHRVRNAVVAAALEIGDASAAPQPAQTAPQKAESRPIRSFMDGHKVETISARNSASSPNPRSFAQTATGTLAVIP